MAPIASSRPPRRQRPRWLGALAVAFLLAAAAPLPARAALVDPQTTPLTWDPQNFIDIVSSLLQVGDTLQQVYEELGYTDFTELISNLPKLLLNAAILEVQQNMDPGLGYLTGPCEQDGERLKGIYQDWVYAMSTYAYFDAIGDGDADPELLEQIMDLPPNSTLMTSAVDNLSKIPYWIAADHANKRILCVFRGSVTRSDWLLDFVAQTRVISPGVGAHDGMTRVAENILSEAADTILAFTSANPGYTLHFGGHSLGAGVCALASYLVKEGRLSGAKLSSLADSVTGGCVATPPVLTMNAASTMDYVYTLRYQIDVVPTASIINFIDLLKAIQDASLESSGQPALRAATAELEQLQNSTGLRSRETADFLYEWRTMARDAQVAEREAFEKFMAKYSNLPGAGDCGPGANRRLLRKGRLPGRKPTANCSEPEVERRAVDADIHTDEKLVPLEYAVGSAAIWPLYSPGMLYQVNDDNCVLTATGPEERWNFVVLNLNMVSDHSTLPDPNILL